MNVASRITSYCCPSCGGFIGEAAPLSEVEKHISGHRLRILHFMATRIGKHVSRGDIEAHLYDGRKDGGPMRSAAVVHVEIGRLRNAIAPFGWTITAGNGRGARSLYRLIPLEAGQ